VSARDKSPSRLWLRCPCDTNLATVEYDRADPGYTGDGLVVTKRPGDGIEQAVHDDRDPADLLAAAAHHYHQGAGRSRAHTQYAWLCRCGEPYVRTHEQVHDAWCRSFGGPEPIAPPPYRYNVPVRGRVVRLTFGVGL
jgi:hypothetical protein